MYDISKMQKPLVARKRYYSTSFVSIGMPLVIPLRSQLERCNNTRIDELLEGQSRAGWKLDLVSNALYTGIESIAINVLAL